MGGSGADGGGGGATAEPTSLVLVRGELAAADLDDAQDYQDGVAAQAEEAAKAAGDIHHEVVIGTTLLGTPENEFLALDRWSSDENLDAFYADPNLQQALAGLFSGPPVIESFTQTDFYGWGDLDAADASEPRYFIVIRGRWVDDPDVIKPQHDAVAAGGEDPAKAAGDVAHVVHQSRTDDREVAIVDVWTDDTNIEAFYSDPAFQQALLPLFDGAPSLRVYASTDWYQW